MSNHERVLKAVYAAVDELNAQIGVGAHVEKSLDEVLYGKDGKLESLDFVTFIMEVETKMNEEFGLDLMITDEDLLSKQKSPFSTMGNLVEYLEKLVTSQESGV